MKALVATSRSQGARSSDYSWCIDGELVWIQEPCADNRERRQPSCGCGRAFAGLNSHRSTTTAEVAEVDLSRDDYLEALRSSLDDGGWSFLDVEELADELLDFAAGFDVGDVIERDLEWFSVRESWPEPP